MIRIYTCDKPIIINGQTHFIIATSNRIVDVFGYYVKYTLSDLARMNTNQTYTDRFGNVNSYTSA